MRSADDEEEPSCSFRSSPWQEVRTARITLLPLSGPLLSLTHDLVENHLLVRLHPSTEIGMEIEVPPLR